MFELSNPAKYAVAANASSELPPKYDATADCSGNDNTVPFGTRVFVVKNSPDACSALPPALSTPGFIATNCDAEIEFII